MKIGELARKAGCPVETIRYYEKKGLLQAPLRDIENNYRCYNNTHLEKLLFIRRCRSLDMTHEEIRALLLAINNRGKDCGPIDARRRQKLSATPDLSGTVLPPCLIPNSALKSAPPFKSVMPKVSACVGLPA
ncbi:TPA: MerR family transcriptional regulator [Pseudomonas aeruginosa]